MKCTFKVSIVGVGKVGSTLAYSLLLDKHVTDIVLVAHHLETAEAERLDLEHALPFLDRVNILATDRYEDVSGSDLIVITAGAAQKPGQTRLDLAQENITLLNDMIPKIYAASPQSVVLIVTNPVDILTYHASKLAPFAFGQVFGSGTLLDTARFRFHLSEIFNIQPRSIHAYILGEHGDHAFPTLSSAHVAGQALSNFPGYQAEKIDEAFKKTTQAAYQIIQAKGATYYAIATVVTSIVRTIYSDARSILPVSIPLETVYENNPIALSLPCVVGKTGVQQVIMPNFSVEEKQRFDEASQALQAVYQQVMSSAA